MRTLRWLLVPLVVLPIAWLLFSGFGRDPRQVASPLIGAPAPAWSLTTLEGETLSSEDLAGRPYILNFWASWCLPACIDEHPVLAAAHDRHGEELAIVGVLFQNAAADAERFLARYGDAGYPHVVDENGTLAIDYGVTGPPETFFVDAGGIIRSKVFGPLTESLMAERLAGILQVARR
jgi:cytochrome c biogenesis protein CcmG, thiol:disulfide interchange protein DsbE